MHVHTLSFLLHNSPDEPAVSLLLQCLPAAGVRATDTTLRQHLPIQQAKQLNTHQHCKADSPSERFGSFTYTQAWTADQHVELHLTADQTQT